jgi:hypothetical protein
MSAPGGRDFCVVYHLPPLPKPKSGTQSDSLNIFETSQQGNLTVLISAVYEC